MSQHVIVKMQIYFKQNNSPVFIQHMGTIYPDVRYFKNHFVVSYVYMYVSIKCLFIAVFVLSFRLCLRNLLYSFHITMIVF